MNDVVDVAERLLERSGPMSPEKLHALLYLAQGHHLAVTGQRLFFSDIQAWAVGPVVADLYEMHGPCWMIRPGFFHEHRSRLARAQMSRITVQVLRSKAPTVLALRTVRRAHRTADRAALLKGTS